MLKVLISFIVGATVGAAAALLLAPSSGEDLRHHLHDVAEADRERMRSEYQKGMGELQSRVDKMSTDIGSAIHKDKGEKAEEVVDSTDDAAPEAA